ncbi:MAG: Rho termination factor N-terminal domain-containing protein, partial [Rubripirellula sp.]
MITTADLKAQTRRELADLARNYGVPGWHGLKKDELVTEIRKVQRRLRQKASAEKTKTAASPAKKKRSTKAKAGTASASPKAASAAPKGRKTPAKSSSRSAKPKPMPKLPEPKVSAKTARIRAQIRKRRETMIRNKDLSTGTLVGGAAVNRGANRTRADEQHQDRIVLMVRDSYW